MEPSENLIADEQFRELFRAESEEHLQLLDAGLLGLEKNPQDRTLLDGVFRSAHSLKGAARMLDLRKIEKLAHQFENILGAARRGEAELATGIIEQLYRQLDTIRKLVQSAVGLTAQAAEPPVEKNTTGPSIAQAVARPPIDKTDKTATVGLPAATPPAPDLVKPHSRIEPITVAPVAPEAKTDGHRGDETGAFAVSATKRFQLNTIRVEPQKLDSLMREVGELIVTKIRFSRRLAELEKMIATIEDWDKETIERHWFWEQAVSGDILQIKELQEIQTFFNHCTVRLDLFHQSLNKMRDSIYEDHARFELIAHSLEEDVRSVRLLPLATIFNLFPRMVRDLAKSQIKEVELSIEGGDIAVDKQILEEIKDPLMHMLRNAVDHGLERAEEREAKGKKRIGNLWLRASQASNHVVIEIGDDGRGLDLDKIRQAAIKRNICKEDELEKMTPDQLRFLIFSPGFSTSAIVTDISGRGVGMNVVRTNVESLKGHIQIESQAGLGCKFNIYLPMTVATTRVLIAAVAQERYAIPIEFVQAVVQFSANDIFPLEGRETVLYQNRPVPVSWLANIFGLDRQDLSKTNRNKGRLSAATQKTPCIILVNGKEVAGIMVSDMLDEQEIVLKPLGAILKRVPHVAGATILSTGEVCMVLNPQDLVKTIRQRVGTVAMAEPKIVTKPVVLLIEDSITTRTQEKRILENAGYEVVIAVDGLDGWNKLQLRPFNAVISDIEMPNMTGLDLTAQIRRDTIFKEMPIILLTSLVSEEDRKRGIAVGANAYLTKSAFDQNILLETLQRLI